jgi:phosphoglycerate kinase
VADQILIGGGMAFPFLAAQGHDVGLSLLDGDPDTARTFLVQAARSGVELVLPPDMTVAAGRCGRSGSATTRSATCPPAGGASLEYLEGKTLPGLAALQDDG